MEIINGYLDKKLGQQDRVEKNNCDHCGAKNSTRFIQGIQKHPQEQHGYANCMRGFCLHRRAPGCPIRYITGPVSQQLLLEYEDVHKLAMAFEAKNKAGKTAIRAAADKVSLAQFLAEEALEEVHAATEAASAAVIAAKAAENSVKLLVTAVNNAGTSTALASAKIAGTTSGVTRKASKSSGAAGSSSPGKRKSDGDSSPCEKRLRTTAGPVASTSKAPVAGSSKTPDNGKGKDKDPEENVINLCSDDEF
ncbi:hypothetical protein AURDEDRAFT_173567 [Auricularia subglabra TFB-10046 SS5]|nr:hypothetical protein AURDEDRAFT_173567 [Auricularia subglabra TFB-10046 SS5]